MKRTKKALALIMALALLVSGLPLSAAAAESKVLVFEGSSRAPDSKNASMDFYALSYDVNLTVTVDMASKTATGSWSRTNCVLSWDDNTYNPFYDATEGKIAYDYFRDGFKENADKAEAVVRELAADTSPHTFKAKAEYWGSAPQGVNGSYSIALTDFEWQSEVFRVDEESSPITAQKWKYPRAIIVNASPNSKYNTSPGHWSSDPKAKFTYEQLQKYSGNLGNFKMYMNLKSGEAVKREFTMGKDNFSFVNHRDSFHNPKKERAPGLSYYGEFISRATYKKLTANRTHAQKAKLNTTINNATGACFGMSVASGMLFWGDLSLSSLDPSAVDTYHLGLPKDNQALMDAIIYYHLMQSDREVSNAMDGKVENKSFKTMVDRMISDLPDKPVVLCLSEKGKKVSEGQRHAVLAYKLEKIEDKEFDYIAYIYDPNTPTAPIKIGIARDRTYWSGITEGDTKDSFADKWSINNALSLTEVKELWDYSAPGADAYYVRVKGGQSIVSVSWGKVTVEQGGKTAVLMDGQKISGDLDIECLGPDTDAGGDPLYHFLLKNVSGPLTFSGNTAITVMMGHGSDKATTAMAENISEKSKFTVSPDGTVQVSNPTASEYVLSVASDLTTSDLFITTVTGNGKGAQIKPATNGAAITTTDGEKVDVDVCGTTNYTVFENVSSANDIVVKNSGSTSTLEDKNGEQLAKGTATENGGGSEEATEFTDVPANEYYAKAVAWAVENNITSGTDKTHFSPNAACTRAQAVTFLWRAAGKPKATGSNPFVDVKKSDYYYDAVIWANERKITSGTDNTHFSPNQKCTRSQIVTFLWRYHSRAKVYRDDIFKDVKYGSYYYDAVIWAYKNDITSGTGKKTFSPDSSCTRAQIVTFLYRDPFSF